MIYRGLTITGTGTGIGKTVIARALVRLFREQGLKVGALKPVETGCEGEDLAPADGLMLMKEAGIDGVGIDDVVPWRFRAPLAPEEAARREGVEITVDRIYQAMDRWAGRADLTIVETAGGLLVPINPRFMNADLIQALELPVIVVAPNRLGVINHALLTLEALRRRQVQVLAVVLNQIEPTPDLAAPGNARYIARYGQVPVHEVPYGGPGDPAATVAAALRPGLAELRQAMEQEWARVRDRYVRKTAKEDGEK